MAPLTFTAAELGAVAAALAAQGTRMSRAALSAARKVVAAEPAALMKTLDGPAERLADVVPLRPRHGPVEPEPSADDEIREVLERAVHDRRVVRIVYTDGRSRPSDREVEPAGLLAADGRWYLVGWCRTRGEGRGFRLDRILGVKITSIPVTERALADVLGPLGQITSS